MLPEIILAAQAEDDIEAAQEWYAQQRDDLDTEFLGEVSKTIKRIAARPESSGFLKQPVRRIFLRRFPYYVAFEIESPELIVVLRVLHNRQLRNF